LSKAIGVVDPTVQGDQLLGVIELEPSLLEFTFVDLKRGIEGGVPCDLFDETRIDPGVFVERFIALLERFRARGLVR